jgi:hypothetical protein
MYLIKLLVFQGIQLLLQLSSVTSSTTDDADINTIIFTNFSNTVKTYYDNNHVKDRFEEEEEDIELSPGCSNYIQKELLQQFIHNLSNILIQLFSYYFVHFPKIDEILKNRKLETTVIEFIQSEYVESICSYIPRCLDFIYICDNNFEGISYILQMNEMFCYSRKVYLTQYEIKGETENRLFSSTDIKYSRIKSLYENIFSLDKSAVVPIHANTTRIDEAYVKEVFEFINKINKTNIIGNSQKDDSSTIVSGVITLNEFSYPIKELVNFQPSNPDTKSTGLADKVKSIVDKKLTKYSIENGDNHLNNLSKLLIKIFQHIAHIFRKSVLTKIGDDSQIGVDQNTIRTLLPITLLDDTDEHILLILYYLIDNECYSDAISLYLTIFSDWINFLNVRCLYEKNNNMYNNQCVKQSINEKLLLNLYKIDSVDYTTFIKYDGTDNYDDYKSIINEIYSELDNYYKDKNINIWWLSFNWLYGVHVYTENQYSDYLNKIKKYHMTIANDTKDSFSLMESYNQIIPWFSNIGTIIGFKILTDRNFILILDDYLNNQAKIIISYFKLNYYNNATAELIKKLTQSFGWYLEARKIFYISINSIMQNKGISQVVELVKKFEVKKNQNLLALNNYLMSLSLKRDTHFEQNLLNAYYLLSNGKTRFETYMNKFILNNCYDAIKSINTYLSIAKKTKIPLENDQVNSILCNDHLTDIFPENHTNDTSQSKSEHEKQEN